MAVDDHPLGAATWGNRGQSWAALGALHPCSSTYETLRRPGQTPSSSLAGKHAADATGLQLIGHIPNANEVAAHYFQVIGGEEDLDDPDLKIHRPLASTPTRLWATRLKFAHNFPLQPTIGTLVI